MRNPTRIATILAGVLLALVAVFPRGDTQAQTQGVDMRLVPEAASIPSGGSIDLTIEVVPNGQQLNGIDICIGFPADFLQVVDAEPDTWCMDIGQVAARITPRTRAIMAVHIYGHPVDMDPLLELAEKHDLDIIEDAAEAHGAQYLHGHN